ncbi:MAG TPA: YebC/PmpR family DNA-binding transcriptional regulator [Candidatus Krumholzibacteria bacterium]|nr:YebC/PmpR family DNA-binding transcriptional regulator [Candidatus Krumholzibacteria bacterium]
MSGHSKWATIKRKKGANDAKRGKLFTRLAKEITIAARDGGGDPEMNAGLRTAINNAKAQNMPNDNIDRAIKRGTGEVDGVSYEEKTFAGFYGGVAILVNTVTDNNNRTTAEVRHVFSKHNGKMVDTGSASIYFERKGIITVSASETDEEKVMEVVIDAGAEDVETEDEVITVTTPREGFHAVVKALESAGIQPQTAELQDVPTNTVVIAGSDAEGLMKLLSVLDDLDDTSSVAANYDIPDDEMAKLQELFG